MASEAAEPDMARALTLAVALAVEAATICSQAHNKCVVSALIPRSLHTTADSGHRNPVSVRIVIQAIIGRVMKRRNQGKLLELTAPLASPLARELAAAVLVARAAVEAAAAAAEARAAPADWKMCQGLIGPVALIAARGSCGEHPCGS